MKRKRIFPFLLQERPDGLSFGLRTLFWFWNILLLLGSAAGLGVLSLVLAPTQYNWELFYDYLDHPVLLALNLIPVAVLMVLFYGLTGRAWLAYLLTALPVLGLSAVNYYKLFYRNIPVLAADLLRLGEAGNVVGKYRVFLPDRLLEVLGCAIVIMILLIMFVAGQPQGRARAAAVLVALVCTFVLGPVYASDDVYQANVSEEHIDQRTPAQRYVSRGLLYPFLHSVKDVLPPPGGGSRSKKDCRPAGRV